MAGSAGRWNSRMPFGFEQAVVGQTNKQRVKCARFQLGFLEQVITVPPRVRPCDQCLKD